ncbi:2-succinyl-5-enolpyruvyl-6-hydroxy-3-cyclohexene-1-carboxylic-acid synthase [Halovivax gelatinilyticus]|uniref:2-succinyl-5-enolpyruvyl-6-hydroxy-3- cyclohexene-1-carboxylic-acid synthase n=1 Tax=Halovivax gelatinilyticus TaxID=2961597 RepID=UPI0020CA8138|nr:2-succinyl-5-enolpyruvyl-6-hydroxy-3-cyclohexene-1-carboxylic-acid synthase [Halovivax gelatinilyticus]
MSAPNRSTLWGKILVDELAAGGLDAVCISPGSRSTPLTVAFAAHPDVEVFSHLDERAGAYFALGRSRRTGKPTAIVCTSGTAVANVHPAVLEADSGRVPLLVLSADRPPELRDSGANQTIDQRKFFGGAVRWSVDLPEPSAVDRTVRSLRTTAARALARTRTAPSGPVHVNCPFTKPLEPGAVTEADVGGDIEAVDERTRPVQADEFEHERDGPYVASSLGTAELDDRTFETLVDDLTSATRPAIVVGPIGPGLVAPKREWRSELVSLAESLGGPILADPLSGVRFGPWADSPTLCCAYDAYVDRIAFDPDCVLRIGGPPTSKSLVHALRTANPTQYLVDPAGHWREATFSATDLLVTDPAGLVARLDARVGDDTSPVPDWLARFRRAESVTASIHDEALSQSSLEREPFEGSILSTVFETTPDPATVFVSNSMPIRDADRFGGRREASLTVLGNRGVSGIDGIVSTALGAGSVDDDSLTLVTGDLACYHDSNGLLAIERAGVDATIVVIHNDGGGIFHALPIADHDPPFTEQFLTPHGLDFEPLAEMYGLEYARTEPAGFERAYRDALDADGAHLLSVEVDAETSHRRREALAEMVSRRLE